MKTVYTIRSIANGKYLTNLFTDYHHEMYQADEFTPAHATGGCYFYNIKEVAEDVARQILGEVVEVEVSA